MPVYSNQCADCQDKRDSHVLKCLNEIFKTYNLKIKINDVRVLDSLVYVELDKKEISLQNLIEFWDMFPHEW